MKRVLFCISILLLVGCSQHQASLPLPDAARPANSARSITGSLSVATTPIQHVVIIVQENRSFDNLFMGFPGANTVTAGQDASGKSIALQPVGLVTTYDPDHSHSAWITDYANGAMNGFSKEKIDNGKGEPADFAYAYVPRAQVKPYWTMAQEYALADNMFATHQGSSFPAHLYLATGTSAIDSTNTWYAMDNAVLKGSKHPGGCDSLAGTTAPLIDPSTGAIQAVGPFPCYEHQTIFDLLDTAQVSWRWYEERYGRGLWYAPDAYKHIRYGADYSNVSAPNTNILTDIKNGALADVSWVMPTAASSDHAHSTDGSGPAWVAEVVNAIGKSSYWNNTAILVTWDEWGGWYDHVAPIKYNHYELGFRVPLIVISPYAKAGYVSHVQHEFGSTLKFLETTYNLGSLNTTDVRADDLSDMFDYSQPPRSFQSIPAAAVPAGDALDTRVPDDD